MATINGTGDGTRTTNWLLSVASAVTIAGILGLVAVAWDNNGTLNRIEARLERQAERDREQDRWIDYFRQRLDEGRRRPRTTLRPSDHDGE